jgi:predicted ATPase
LLPGGSLGLTRAGLSPAGLHQLWLAPSQIIAKTDGIPLFVEELTKAVLEAGILVEDTEGYRLDSPLPPLSIPASLHDSLMARLDRLAPVKEIAQVGAAIGREFSYALLHAVTGCDEGSLNAALSQLEEAELLFCSRSPPDVRYSFKHALVQDAAYESLLKSRRQVLHQRVAEVLRDRFPKTAETEPEIVAHHFTRAGLTEFAVEWWGKAGERAARGSAHNEAIAHLEKAIKMAQTLADGPAKRLRQLQLQTTYGYALLHGRGQTSAQTMAAFARARELASAIDDATERASVYWAMWVTSYARADLSSMQELADAMLRDAQRTPESREADMAARQVFGITRWFAGDYLSAHMHLESAVAAYSYERDHHLAARFGFDLGVLAMFVLVRVLWALGEVDRAVQLAEQGLSLALQTAHIPSMAFAWFASCFFAALRRKPDQAMPHAQALVALAREHGLPQWLAYGTCCFGWALSCAGDRQGELKMREGLELLREQQVHNNLRLFYVLLAEIEADSNQLKAGLATLSAEHEAIEQSGVRWFHAEVHRARGELLLRDSSDNLDAAETAFTRAIEIARSQQTRTFELRAVLALAKLYQATARGEAACELLAPAVAGFTEGPELPEVEQANRLLADLVKRADSTEVTKAKVMSQTHP